MNKDQSDKNGNSKVRLSRLLPRGSLGVLAEKYGISKAQVSRILSGKSRHDKVLMDALDIAEKAKAEADAREEKINERLAKLTA